MYGASRKCAQAKCLEVIAADVLAAHGMGDAIALAAAGAYLRASSLKGGQFLELRGVLLHEFIEGVREHAPVVLRAAFDTTICSFADAVETRGIDHRQRLEQDRKST